MKLKTLAGVFVVGLALPLQFSTGAPLAPCTSTQTPNTTCHLHRASNYGYSICTTEYVEGPTEDINFGPGGDFIVTRVYRVPWTSDYYKWNVDNEQQTCLSSWSAHVHSYGDCQDYDISMACIPPGGG
jgi:hypothetical protein